MAEETQKRVAQSAVVSDVPEADKVEKDVLPETVKDVAACEDEKKVCLTTSFKEESNVVSELNDLEKKGLDELKQLVLDALKKHEFTVPPPCAAEESSEKMETVVIDDNGAIQETMIPVAGETVPPPEKEVTVVIDEDGAKKIEAIQETIKPVTVETIPPPCTTAKTKTPITPEQISIWGIPLLADERSDVILLKFLRARDFKIKEAFTMLKNVVAWRKDFGIESLIEEELGTNHEKTVYIHGIDKNGHPVCYNALDQETFSDEKFLRWRIQFLEKSIRNLDFNPGGISTIVQVNDLKYSPALFKKELRQVVQLLQDNYPEFLAKQVFINVPWWYLAFYKMTNAFFTQRTKSKFVFAGPSKTIETLFKYISPELVPVQYGGLSRDGEQEFTTTDLITQEIIKPSCEHVIELLANEACTLVWEARVVGYEVSYGAEFVPSAENGYTVIVQKSRNVTSDESVICGRFKCGESGKVVLAFYNQGSKKKKVVYRFKKVA